MAKDRLFEMLYMLMKHDGITAAKLAERFEVSTRTIYRDVESLSGAGIPVYTERGKSGGIRLLGEFVLDKSLLTAEEQNEILFALQSLKATSAIENEQTISRLSGLFQKNAVDWIDVDFSRWGSGEGEKIKFQFIKNGILEQRVLSFRYYNTAGQESLRMTEPLKLRFKSGSWYLLAHCRTKKELRLFKISRMEQVCLLDERFRRPVSELPAMEPPETRRLSSTALELLFTPKAAYRIYESFNRKDVTRNEDGSYSVSVTFPEDQWLMGFLLSFGPELLVLSPNHIREKLREMAEKVESIYTKS